MKEPLSIRAQLAAMAPKDMLRLSGEDQVQEALTYFGLPQADLSSISGQLATGVALDTAIRVAWADALLARLNTPPNTSQGKEG